ncbi:recombinase family protein [Streptomyces sp. NPDC049915]|uniref:recombinase family protein n=1 Tax=Streptomyces sp. NPDC049915 TaxID=3155510 RepID=UPI003425BC62
MRIRDSSRSRRPALADALSEVEDGQAAGIVVGRLDRLARRLVTQEAILAQQSGDAALVCDTP